MQFTCNSTPRTCQCTLGYFSKKPCWVEVWGPEWIRNPVHLILQHKMTFKHSLNSWTDYGVIMNPAAPHTDIVCLATCKHDLTGNRPAHTHTNTCEFRGSVGHQLAPVQRCPAISCADTQDTSVSSRGNSGFFYVCLGSEPCCLWLLRLGFCYMLLPILKSHSPVSYDQEV